MAFSGFILVQQGMGVLYDTIDKIWRVLRLEIAQLYT